MNIKKNKLDLYKALYTALRPRFKEILSEEQCMILHLHLMENMGYMEIAEKMQFSNYKIVKDELENIEFKILALA